MTNKATLCVFSLIGLTSAHYTFPWLNVDGVNNTFWASTRITNNYDSLNPVTDVNSSDIRCYDSAPPVVATPVPFTIAAGTPISIGSEPGGVCCGTYHQSVSQVYMAQVPSGEDAATWEPTDAVWFKVAEVPPITDGGTTITWVAMGAQYVNFTIPSELPSGTYLVRTENIALQSASVVSGAQFYLSCTLLEVTGGGSGTPGPLVAFPGAYTGYEPGILLNIFYPVPATYTMPGPAIWPAVGGSSTSSSASSSPTSVTTTSASKATTVTTTTTTTTTTTSAASGATQTAYGQCGGDGWTGATVCVSGYDCDVLNEYYSQCVPDS